MKRTLESFEISSFEFALIYPMFTLHLFKKKKKGLVAAHSCCISSDEFNQKYRSKRACEIMQRVSCEKITVQM